LFGGVALLCHTQCMRALARRIIPLMWCRGGHVSRTPRYGMTRLSSCLTRLSRPSRCSGLGRGNMSLQGCLRAYFAPLEFDVARQLKHFHGTTSFASPRFGGSECETPYVCAQNQRSSESKADTTVIGAAASLFERSYGVNSRSPIQCDPTVPRTSAV